MDTRVYPHPHLLTTLRFLTRLPQVQFYKLENTMCIAKKVMLFVVTMVCLFSTMALESASDVEDRVTLEQTGLRRRLQGSLEVLEAIEDQKTLEQTGLRRRLQSEDIEDKSTLETAGLQKIVSELDSKMDFDFVVESPKMLRGSKV